MSDLCGIYAITNKINDKKYIGQSVNIKKRWRKHRLYLKTNKHWNGHLQQSWNKHSPEVFCFDVLILCSENDLDILEEFCIDYFNAMHNDHGFNMLKGGHNHPDISGDNNPMKRLSVRMKVSNARRGIKFSEEHKNKLRLAKLGKKRNPHTKETKKRMSEASKGSKNSMYGKVWSREEKKAKKLNLIGRIGIIKDGKQKFVKKDSVGQYVNDGWMVGGRTP